MGNGSGVLAIVALVGGAACVSRPDPLPTGPLIGLSTQEVQLAHCADAGHPGAPQTVLVSNVGSGVLVTPGISVRYVEQPGEWLHTDLSTDGSGYQLALRAQDPGGEPLPAGSYHATVILDSPGAGNTPAAVSVTNQATPRTLTAPRKLPVIVAALGRDGWSRPLQLEEPLGCDLPEPTVSISYPGPSGWLELGPWSATWPDAMQAGFWWSAELRPRSAALPAGEYHALVTASAAGAGLVDVPVQLEVRDWGLVPPPETFACALPRQLADGRVICADAARELDLATGRWVETSWSPSYGYAPVRTAVLADGNVILFAYVCADQTCSSSFVEWEVFDPAADPATARVASGSTAEQMPDTVTALADGRVLLLPDPWLSPGLPTAVLDPTRGTIASGGEMSMPRVLPSVVRLADGRILCAGGYGLDGTYQRSAEIFDPVAGSWSSTGDMGDARILSGAALLPDGRVLVAGGYGVTGAGMWGVLSSAEIYDAAQGGWSFTGKMSSARYRFGDLLVLGDGTVLATGGASAANAPMLVSERYDPAAGRWSPWATLPAGAINHGTFLVEGSWVLVVGSDAEAFIHIPGWIRRAAYP